MANNKPRQNYFDQTIRQYGEDFVYCLTPDNIQRSAKRRIFKEMVQGQIDYSIHGKYFSDPKFFENLLIASWDELQNNSILLSALREYDLHHPGDNRVIINVGRYNSLVYIFTVLYNKLYYMKQDNYNVGHLADISAQLYQYRNLL